MTRDRYAQILSFVVLAMVIAAPAAAQTTALTPLVQYDAGENIVSYFRYVAFDCPDEAACRYTGVVTTPSRSGHVRVQAVITGFKLWIKQADISGPLAVRSRATRNSVGSVDLMISGRLTSPKNRTFSYEITVAVIESTVEGFALTEVGAACPFSRCPVTMTAPGAVPAGYNFLGFGLAQFDSDRLATDPFWGAVALPKTTSVDPNTGNVTASLACGTRQVRGTSVPTLSGPCETRWIAIAARPNNVVGGPAAGLPLTGYFAPFTGVPGAALSASNPATVQPTLFCAPHPNPARGFLDALAGFQLLAGQVSGSIFTPSSGVGYGLEVSVTNLTLTAAGQPQEAFTTSLPALLSPPVVGMPQTMSPLTYVRLMTSVCL